MVLEVDADKDGVPDVKAKASGHIRLMV
jgi:hypothetical protein